MYKCKYCNLVFETPKIEQDSWETYYVCPHCGSEELEYVQPCVACGDMAQYKEMLCRCCKRNLVRNVRRFVDGIAEFYNLEKNDAIEEISEILEES